MVRIVVRTVVGVLLALKNIQESLISEAPRDLSDLHGSLSNR